MFPAAQCIVLQHIFRQTDMRFIDLLNELRVGHVTAASWAVIKSCERNLPVVEGIEPTELFATKVDVDALNTQRLNSLPGTATVFTARDLMGMGRTGQCSTAATAVGQQADAHFQARRQLILKVNELFRLLDVKMSEL